MGIRMAIKCKRIIEGKTYNTETATQIAAAVSGGEDDRFDAGAFLYQSRFGAFFLYSYLEDFSPEDDYEKIEPLTPEQARKWLEDNQSYHPDLIEKLFGEMPEAGSGESKFTLRMPDSLRDRLAVLAKANNQSLNAWIVRCLEACAAETAPGAEHDTQNDIPPVGNIVGNNRAGWRTRGT